MIREQLLRMFDEAGERFLSGEEISRRLKCSRTAVWKHIEELRKEGYQFEAVRRSGYRLLHAPDRMTAEAIKRNLHTKWLGQRVVYRDSIDSTQRLAHELAKEGAEAGTIVVADEQTGGKGRMERPWYSGKGTGIWMSIILRPNLPLQKTPPFTLVTSVGVVRALRERGAEAGIKWPNDIFLNGKKICGILTELNAEPDRVHYLVIGIGMNVNVKAEQLPPELRDVATSLQIETDKEVRRAPLACRLLEELETLYEGYVASGFAEIKKEWEAYEISLGKFVTVRTISGEKRGWARELTEEGALLLEEENGAVSEVYSADIQIHDN